MSLTLFAILSLGALVLPAQGRKKPVIMWFDHT